MAESEGRVGILCGGNWIIDHVKIIDTFPGQDALASILSQSRGTGGTPYNVLIDLAKLGARFPLSGVGLVGDDDNGKTIRDDCHRFGIDATQLHTTREASTSYTDVMTVRSTGRRTFFHMRGANSLLAEEHFDLASSKARIFQLGYVLLLDTLDEIAADGTTGAGRLLKQARELGFKTSLDVVSEDSDRFVSVVTPALPHVDYLIINEFEASRSTGIDVSVDGVISYDRASEAAQRLLELGVNELVVIHFPEGSLARSRSGEEARQGSVQVPSDQIAGAAGAGDAFAAGMLFGLHDGLPIQECLKLAVAAAASNLSDPTCTGGIKPREECLKVAEELGFRAVE
jgi:sugar/nucleoside kinase (ribokinase family)